MPTLKGVGRFFVSRADIGVDRVRWVLSYSPDSSMVGKTIAQYKIEQELGRGSMGVVYRAHDNKLLRKVAVKILPVEIANTQERRARVLAEARACSALNHPGVTAIYEIGEQDEHLFIAMELVQGETLRSTLNEGPLQVRTVARIGVTLAEILEFAHAHGVIHGDIKPDNIIALPDGRVKLVDFGLARNFDASTMTSVEHAPEWLTESHIVGTLAYMAPEQLRGQTPDARTDLYALGVVLYELVSGVRPFPGNNAALLYPQILNDHAAALRSVAPSVPEDFSAIVMKLLVKNPQDRYQDARECRIDLLNVLRKIESGLIAESARTTLTVAVLPFSLVPIDSQHEFLGSAMADALINSLNSTGKLLVRPTSAVMRYAGKSVDPTEVAKELNVDILLQGSIQKMDQNLRVQISGWNQHENRFVFAEKHDSTMQNLFDLQDRVAEQVRRSLGLKRGDTETVEPPTKNPLALDLYLRAMDRLARLNRWDTRTAIEMLQNATRLDVNFADAWARLAEACILMAVAFEPGPTWLKEAEAATRKAIKLDPANAAAHTARGQLLWSPAKKFQNVAALRALNSAMRLNPGQHRARQWQCLIFLHIGLLKESRKGLMSVLAVNPDDAFTLVFLGQTAMYAGNYDEADEYNARTLSVDRGHIWGNCFYPTVFLYNGNLERAEKQIEVARQAVPNDSWLTSCEALLWAKRGEMQKADKMVTKAVRDNNLLLHTHHMWHTAAAVYSLAGKHDAAIDLLEQSDALGLPNYNLFRTDYHFESLREHPRFKKLMAKMKKESAMFEREFGEE